MVQKLQDVSMLSYIMSHGNKITTLKILKKIITVWLDNVIKKLKCSIYFEPFNLFYMIQFKSYYILLKFW